jgi:hypothetical protein
LSLGFSRVLKNIDIDIIMQAKTIDKGHYETKRLETL